MPANASNITPERRKSIPARTTQMSRSITEPDIVEVFAGFLLRPKGPTESSPGLRPTGRCPGTERWKDHARPGWALERHRHTIICCQNLAGPAYAQSGAPFGACSHRPITQA